MGCAQCRESKLLTDVVAVRVTYLVAIYNPTSCITKDCINVLPFGGRKSITHEIDMSTSPSDNRFAVIMEMPACCDENVKEMSRIDPLAALQPNLKIR